MNVLETSDTKVFQSNEHSEPATHQHWTNPSHFSDSEFTGSRFQSLYPLSRVHGAHIDRRRIFITLVRRDCLSDETLRAVRSHDQFSELISSRALSMRMPHKYDWILVVILWMFTTCHLWMKYMSFFSWILLTHLRRTLCFSPSHPAVERDREQRLKRKNINREKSLSSLV